MFASTRCPSDENGTGRSLARASLVLALAPCLFVLGWLYEPIGVLGWAVTSPFAVLLATAAVVLGYLGTVWLAFIVLVVIVIAESDLTF